MKVFRALPMAASAALVTFPAVMLAPEAGYAAPDEIVVSVRRKDENLQDVPIAVSTIDDEQISRYGIDTLGDVAKYSPGLQFDEGFGAQDTRIVIRGLSPTRGRSNVALLVDGVDFTGEAVGTAGGGILVNQQLLDIERVEVVKGPQSALYGRSAFGGAIQYVSKKPSLEEFEGTVGIDLGSASDSRYSSRISGAWGAPITENFGLRVNGLMYDKDGFYDNALTGESVGGSDGFGLALSGLWQATDNLSFSGRLAGSQDSYEPQAQARVDSNAVIDIDDSVAVINGDTPTLVQSSGPPPFFPLYPDCNAFPTGSDGTIASCLGGSPKVLTVGTMPSADQLTIWQNANPRTGSNYYGTEVETITGTLKVEWVLDAGVASSYTGFAALNSDQLFDGQNDVLLPGVTYTSLDSTWPGSTGATYSFTLPDCGFANCSPAVQEINFENQTRLFSQEFRYASDLEGPLNYTVGALFWKENIQQRANSFSVSPAIFRGAFGPPGTPLPVLAAGPGNAVIAGGINSPGADVTRRETESLSLYGLLEWELDDAWKVSVEGRWIDEDLRVAGGTCDINKTPALTGLANQAPDANGDVFCNSSFRGASSVAQSVIGGTLPVGTYTRPAVINSVAKFSESFFAPKATVEFKPSDDALYYASIAQGIKPGGISTITAGSFFQPDLNTFKKEKLISYEIGAKRTLMDGDLLVNTALFYQDYTDKQVGVSRFDPVIQTDVGGIENAGESEIWGIELEAIWQVTENLTLAGGYTYVDSEYSKFVLETSSSNNVARSLAAGGGGCLAIIDNPTPPSGGRSDFCVVDLTGNQVEDVPEHSFVGNARYQAPLGDGGLEWYADASVIYRDERAMDEFNVKWLDSYVTADLRGGVIGDSWEVIGYIDNVFDDDTVKSGVDFGSQVNTVREGQFPPGPTDGVIVTMPDPRVVGVRASFSF